MRPGKNNRSGFTLIELLVVSSMTVILAGVGVSSYINQQRYSVLKNTAEEVVASLNDARQRSISQEESSNWGMRFNNSQTEVDSYALFVGATYSSAREQRYFPSFLEFTNPLLNESTNIIFAKITGKTIDGLPKVAAFKISGTNIYVMVTVTGEGLISYTISGSGGSGDAIIALPGAPDMNCGGGDQYILLSWPKPDENGSSIISYRVYRGLSSGGETLLTSINAPGTSPITYNDPNLTNGINYYYQVTAINAIGESQRSIERMCAPSTFPAAPTNLTVVPDDRQCNLLWGPPVTDNGSPIIGYKVYRGTAPNPTILVQTLGNVLNYPDPGLINGATYYYRLKAVNAAGESVDYSNEVSCAPILLPPTGLGATYGDQQCSLSWTASASLPVINIAGYNLYRDTSSPPVTKILPELGNIVSYINTGLTNGATYYYCLKTRNTGGNESVCGNIVSCQPKTVPGAPTNLTATGENTSVTLNWTAPTNIGGMALTAYKLFRDTVSPAATLFKTLGVVTSYIDVEAAAGSVYYYRLKAVNSVGDSAFSNEATGSTFCTGKANGATCAATVPGSCSCTYSTCACSASGTQTDTIYTCQSQACVPSSLTGACACSRTCPGSSTSCGTSTACACSGNTGSQTVYACNGIGSCVSSSVSCATPCPSGYHCSNGNCVCTIPPPVYGVWSACGGCSYASTCAVSGAGTQTRSLTTYTCDTNCNCVASNTTESQSCSCGRITDGTLCNTACGPGCGRFNYYCSGGSCSTTGVNMGCVSSNLCPTCQCCVNSDCVQPRVCDWIFICSCPDCPPSAYSAWSACGGCSYASTCAVSGAGTQTRSLTTYTSDSNCNCVASNTTESQSCSCTRSTAGATCAATVYGACGYATICAESGTQSVTTYTCQNQSCAGTTTSASCGARSTAGTSCGASYWACSGAQACPYNQVCSAGSCVVTAGGSCANCTCNCTNGSCNAVYSCGRCSNNNACQYASFSSCSSACTGEFWISYSINTGCTSLCVNAGYLCCSAAGACSPCN
jgi:prepilin-type N-terminal cleavage/methylation domain-containing protein